MTSWFVCVTCAITLGTSCAQTTWRLCCARRLKMDHMSVGMYCRMSQDVTWSFDFSSRYFQCTDKHDAGDKFFSWFDRSTGQRATRQQYLFPRCAYYEPAHFWIMHYQLAYRTCWNGANSTRTMWRQSCRFTSRQATPQLVSNHLTTRTTHSPLTTSR